MWRKIWAGCWNIKKKVQFSRCEKMMVTMTKRERYMWVGYTPEEEDTMGKTHTLSQTQLWTINLWKIEGRSSPFLIKQRNHHNLKPQIIKQTFQILRNLHQRKREGAECPDKPFQTSVRRQISLEVSVMVLKGSANDPLIKGIRAPDCGPT